MHDLSTIGGRLKAARLYRNLSRKSLLEKAGVYLNEQAVTYWESARYEIRTHNLTKICDALEISVDWLLRGPDGITQLDETITPYWLQSPSVPESVPDGAERVFGSMRRVSPLPGGEDERVQRMRGKLR